MNSLNIPRFQEVFGSYSNHSPLDQLASLAGSIEFSPSPSPLSGRVSTTTSYPSSLSGNVVAVELASPVFFLNRPSSSLGENVFMFHSVEPRTEPNFQFMSSRPMNEEAETEQRTYTEYAQLRPATESSHVSAGQTGNISGRKRFLKELYGIIPPFKDENEFYQLLGSFTNEVKRITNSNLQIKSINKNFERVFREYIYNELKPLASVFHAILSNPKKFAPLFANTSSFLKFRAVLGDQRCLNMLDDDLFLKRLIISTSILFRKKLRIHAAKEVLKWVDNPVENPFANHPYFSGAVKRFNEALKNPTTKIKWEESDICHIVEFFNQVTENI